MDWSKRNGVQTTESFIFSKLFTILLSLISLRLYFIMSLAVLLALQSLQLSSQE